MKPLVTTVEALKEIATGLSPDAISTHPGLFQHSSKNFEFLIASTDTASEQRIIVMRDQNHVEPFVPEHLTAQRSAALGRMTSFAERARTPGPLTLPRPWRQYKHQNLVAFFALPSDDPNANRWIAEVRTGERADVCFWTTTTSAKKEYLNGFTSSFDKLFSGLEEEWASAFASAQDEFLKTRSNAGRDVEISLAPFEQSATKGWSYDRWLESVSDDQRSFIEAPTDRAIRLRGPAGSGKTLAITMKAVREVMLARAAAKPIRALVVTHSWSLASEISDSIDSLGLGLIDEIDTFPLLEIAKNVSPQYVNDESGFSLVGTDNFSGKQAQLSEILELVHDFLSADWLSLRSHKLSAFQARFESDDEAERLALAWDLLVEFGSVIGPAAIFPGDGSESKYFNLSRASWMLPLDERADLRIVYHLYSNYIKSLEDRALLTADQVLADLLSHLETHAWNRARKTQGYDLIFVDEFHLFSPLERDVLHYLSRDSSTYPRIFMAVDPRQSPSEAFIGVAADETFSTSGGALGSSDDIDNFELTTVHRFTPQILSLIKHVHHEFPTLNLGKDWDVDYSRVESSQESGPLPQIAVAASQAGEGDDIVKAVHELYPEGRMALAIVDSRQWPRYSELASRIGNAKQFHVSSISARSDIEGIGYRGRGLVVGPAEYLAGLQFDTVLVAGLSDMQSSHVSSHERNRLLSFLYLALSRARREVRIFVNEDDGGSADLFTRASKNRLLTLNRGSLV